MNKRARRKWQIARRATAFLLSLAMVFSVIYLNDRKKVSEAEGETPTVTIETDILDISYLNTVDLEQEGATTTVYVPSDKISFQLPSTDGLDPGYNYVWAEVRPSEKADKTVSVTPLAQDVLSATQKEVTLYRYKDGDDTEDPKVDAEIDSLRKFKYEVKAPVALDQAVQIVDGTTKVVITGDDDYSEEDSDTTMYYGKTEYACETASAPRTAASQVSGWGSFDAIDSALNADGEENDKSYVISKKLTLKGSQGTNIVFFHSILVERDTYMDLKATLQEKDGGSVGPTADTDITIDKVIPKADVTLTFASQGTDEPITKIVAEKQGEPAETPIEVTSGNSIVFPGNEEKNSGQEFKYKVTVSATDKNAKVYNVKIKYVSPNPTISNVVVNDQNNQAITPVDGIYYIPKDGGAKFTATVETAQDVKTDKAQLREKGSVTPVASVTLNGSTNAKAELDYTPAAPGQKEFVIFASSDMGGETTTDDSYKVFYDDSLPEIGEIDVTQTISGTDKTQKVESGTVATRLTASQDFKLSINATDKKNTEESKIDSVTVEVWGDKQSATKVGDTDVYELTMSPKDGFAGNAPEFKVTVRDKAGNITEQTFKLPFSDDRIEIASEIQGPEGQTIAKDTIIGFGAFTIKYTFTTDTALTGAELTYTNDGVKTTVPINQAQLGDPTESGKDKIYTYIYKVDESASTKLENITMTATNENDKVANPDKIDFITIDLSDPTYDLDNTAEEIARITEGKWFRELVLIVKFSDGGSYDGGFDPMKVFDSFTGVTVESRTVEEDGKSGVALLKVNPSTSLSGTDVSFTFIDKLGNKSKTYNQTIYVDAEEPRFTEVRVGGQSGSSILTKRDPIVMFYTSDNIEVTDVWAEIIKPDGTAVNITSFIDEWNNLAGTKLSKLLGMTDTPQDGKYSLVMKLADHPIETVAAPVEPVVTKTCTFELDNTPPTVSATYTKPSQIKNGKYTSSATVQITLFAEDKNLDISTAVVKDNKSTRKVKWSSSPAGGQVAYLTVSGEGEHVVTLSVKDKNGFQSDTSLGPFIIDLTDPKLDVRLSPKTNANGFISQTGTVTVAVTDKNEDKAHGLTMTVVEMPSDGSKTTTNVYPDQKAGSTTFGNNSKYVVTYTATDLSGRTSSDKVSFTVDTIKPISDIALTSPTDAAKFDRYHATYSNSEKGTKYDYAQYFKDKVPMTITAEDFNLSRVQITDNGNTVVDKSGIGTTSFSTGYTAESEGMHNITVTSWDKADKVSTTQSVSFVIDKTAPTLSTTLNASPFTSGGETRYLPSNATLAVTVSDANKDTEDLKRTLKTTIPGSGTSTSTDAVAEGSQDLSTEADYEVSYVATDRAGNVSSTHSASFRVDKTPPELRISGAVQDGTSREALNIVYNVREAFYSDMPRAVVQVYQKVDGSAEKLLRTVDFKATGQDSSMTERFEDDGVYRFVFEAEDRAGNKTSTNYSFILDATAPTVVLSGVKNYDKTSEDVTLTITVDETFFSSNKVVLKGTRIDIDGVKHDVKFSDFAANTGKISKFEQLFKEDGIYDITITSTDKAGNSSTQKIHFTKDTTDPEIKGIDDYDGTKINSFKWGTTAEEMVRDLTVCDIKVYMDGVEYDGLSDLADGSHVLRVIATDELGHTTDREVSFVLDTIAPNILISGVEEGQYLKEATQITVSVQIDEDTLTRVTLDGKEIEIVNGVATFTVNQRGQYTIFVEAIDEAGNVATKQLNFNFGDRFPWWIFLVGAGGIFLMILLLLLARRRKDKKAA